MAVTEEGWYVLFQKDGGKLRWIIGKEPSEPRAQERKGKAAMSTLSKS